MLKVGSKNVTALKVGTKNVVKVYKGTTLVWPTTDLLSVTPSSLSFSAAGQTQNLTINVPAGQAWTLSVPSGSAYSVSKTSGTGKTTISVTVGNNTTTSNRSSVLTVFSIGLTAICNCSQTAGSKVYSNPIISTYSYPLVSAAGGTATPTVSYSQTWTWNGVAGTGGTITSGASLSYSGTNINTTSGVATVASKGTTISNTTTVTTGTVKVTLNGKSASKSATITQAANAVTKTTQSGGVYTYGNVTAGAITNATILASGGSATATAGNGSQSWSRTAIIATDTYTSGSTAQRTVQGATSGTNTVAPSRTSLSGTAGSKGQVTSGQTTVQSATVTWSANGKSASGTMYVYQQENKLIWMTSNCSGYTRYGVREYTSGSYEYSEQNSYYCGYRETVLLSVSVMQSGIMREPVFKSLQAWSCRTGNVQGQGSSTVTFSNPKFGRNTATLELSESEKNYGYVLFQLQMTYTDSGGPGAHPTYVWSGAVTYSGSLAIYTNANAIDANVTVSAGSRSLSLQEDASNLLAQAESAGIELPDEIKSELSAIAEGKE